MASTEPNVIDGQPSAKKIKLDCIKVDEENADENGDNSLMKATKEVKAEESKVEVPEKKETMMEEKGENPTNGKTEVAKPMEKKEPEGKPSGVPLICGCLNWDLCGRTGARVGVKPRKVEPAWTPQVIGALSKHRVTDVITGPCASHAFFITDKGELFGLGRNETGQLGMGNIKRQDGAIEIPFFKGMKVLTAACGKGHSVVVTERYGTFAMGDNTIGQLGIGSGHSVGNKGKGTQLTTPKLCVIEEKIKQVSCGGDFTLFLSENGTVYSSGSSESGQLGINDNGEYIESRKLFYTAFSTPVKVHSFFSRDVRTKQVTRVPNVSIKQISAGNHHCLAVSENHELFTWGFNGHGRLGHKTTENELIPMRVNYFRPGDVKQGIKMAKCSFNGCFALNNLGTVYLWGENNNSRFECPYPIPMDDLYGWNINDMAPGWKHHLITADYSTIAFGKQTMGELGIGDNVKSSSRPDKLNSVEGLKVIQCAAGVGLSLFLALDDDDEAKNIIQKLPVNDD